MMRRLLAFFLGLMPALVGAGNGPHLCQWGSACSFPVDIYAPDGVDFALTADIAIPAGDVEWYCPGQAVSSTGFTVDEITPRGFVLNVPAALTDCARFEVKIRDQDATPLYLDMSVHVETCGDASAAYVNCSGALALASTALSNVTWTDARAGNLDNLDTGVSTRAPASTALSNTTWTNPRAANLDNLDASVASRSSHAPTAIVSAGAINTSGGAVSTVTTAQTVSDLGPGASSDVTVATKQALADYHLDQLGFVAWDGTMTVGSVFGDMIENVAGLRYTTKAMEQAPSGTGSGDVTSWNGVPLSTTNPLPNAEPGTDGGLPTVNASLELAQQTTVAANNDKGGYTATVSAYDGGLSFNANQVAQILAEALAALDSRRLNEMMSSALQSQPEPGSLMGDLTQDSTTIPGTQQFTADSLAQAPTATSLDAEALRLALGGFSGLITSVVNDRNFILDNGPATADSINDEFTAIFEDTSNSELPVCHRQVQDWTAGAQLTIDRACPAAYTQAVGDRVIVLPNGAGDVIASVNVNNGAVETDLTVAVDGSLSLGCMLSAINAVETGPQTVVGGTDYTYRNPGDTEDRVVATRTATGRTQATITCPAGL